MGGLVAVADALIVFAMALATYGAYPVTAGIPLSSQYTVAWVLGAALASLAFHGFGAYRGAFLFAAAVRLGRVLLAWLGVFGLLLGAAFALKITGTYSRIWAMSWLIATAATLSVFRLVLAAFVRRWARMGKFANRTAIVGCGVQAKRLFGYLGRSRFPLAQVIGFVRSPDCQPAAMPPDCPELGTVDDLMNLIRCQEVDHVIVALPWSETASVHRVLETLSTTPVLISLAPDLLGFEFADRPFTRDTGLPMLNLLDRPISGWAQVAKRAEDLALGSCFLILFAPLMAMIAVAVKLDSRGPVLFRQRRQGFNDEMFEVWKFRTIRHDHADPKAGAQVTRGDRRVTRVGRFLRKYGLDELPQLINVLGGRMSLVGPRPHAPGTKAEGAYFQDVVDRYAARHRVKPGITGWAQTNGWRGETDTVEKIRRRVDHDLYYIDHWSLWFDLRIILATPFTLLAGQNAY